MLLKKVLKANILFWGGLVLFISSFFILSATQNDLCYLLLGLGVGCFLGGMLYADRFGLRCPACGSSLYYFLMIRPGYGWWLGHSVQVCPYCSHHFDDEWTEQTAIVLPAALEEKPGTFPVVNTESDAEQDFENTHYGTTGRELIRERGRSNKNLFLAGMGLSLTSLLLVGITQNNAWLILFVTGMPIMWFADFNTSSTVLRCPWCNHGLSSMTTKLSGGLPEEMKVCPRCSRKFDDLVSERMAATKGLPKYPE